MNPSLPSCPPRFARLSSLVFAVVLASCAFGKGGPTVTVDGDVNVAEPVEVTGVVETLNDVLYAPYVRRGSDSLEDGAPARSLVVNFDVPDGKRLIIETVTFQAQAATGTESRVFLEPQVGPERLLCYLAVQSMIEGYMIATHPLKLRIDAVEGSTTEVRVRLGHTPGSATLGATVFGYLVDL